MRDARGDREGHGELTTGDTGGRDGTRTACDMGGRTANPTSLCDAVSAVSTRRTGEGSSRGSGGGYGLPFNVAEERGTLPRLGAWARRRLLFWLRTTRRREEKLTSGPSWQRERKVRWRFSSGARDLGRPRKEGGRGEAGGRRWAGPRPEM